MARAASATARGIFPGELTGEEDCDGSGQERRNTPNSHSSIRMEDTLLARSFCQSTSLQQLVKHCIYLMYLFQIQTFCPWFGLAGSSYSSRSCLESSWSLDLTSPFTRIISAYLTKTSMIPAFFTKKFCKYRKQLSITIISIYIFCE